jgi:hypothetical protein
MSYQKTHADFTDDNVQDLFEKLILEEHERFILRIFSEGMPAKRGIIMKDRKDV